VLRKADAAYYFNGDPIFTDEIYDVLLEMYRVRWKIEKGALTFDDSVGLPSFDASATTKVRAKLPFPVGRTLKFVWGRPNVETQFAQWKRVYGTGGVVVSHKLDGCSGVYANVDGVHTLQTREGIDISHMLPLLKLPKLPINTGVRGELIINRDLFANKWEAIRSKKHGRRATARGAIGGQFGAKASADPELISDFSFVVYEFIESSIIVQRERNIAGLARAAALGFDVVPHEEWSPKFFTLDGLRTALVEARLTTEYDIDGLVVTYNGSGCDRSDVNSEGKPRYVFAFKENPKGRVVTVNRVTWSVTRTNRLNPVIEFDKVWLGTNVERASAYNAAYVNEHGIGKGSTVRIVKAGDVIPAIVSIISKAPGGPDMPAVAWHWDYNRTVALVGDKDGHMDDESKSNIMVDMLYFFINKIGVKHVAAKFIKAVFSANRITSIRDILHLDDVCMDGIPGVGEQKQILMRNGVASALRSCSLQDFIAATQILGTGIGSRKLKQFVPEHFSELLHGSLPHDAAYFVSFNGIGPVLAERLAQKWPDFLKFWTDCVPSSIALQLMKTAQNSLTHVKIKAKKRLREEEKGKEEEETGSAVTKKVKTADINMDGQHILLTGFRDSEIQEFLEDAGALAAGFSKSLTILVVKDDSVNNKKVEKAKKQGVTIMSREAFRTKFMKSKK